jgi:Tfp pilus assembly protein PilF
MNRPFVASRLVAVGAALLVSASFLAAPATFAAEEKKQSVTEAVYKKLKPAQDAFQKGDYDAAIAGAKEALALSTKTYDKQMSLGILLPAFGKKSDFASYAEYLEQLMALDAMTPEERTKSYKTLAQIYGNSKAFDKAVPAAQKWAEGGGGSEAYSLLANFYLVQKDCANGIVALKKAIAGREPTEQELVQENFCYYQLKDKVNREVVMEALVAKYIKRDYVADLFAIYQDNKIDDRAALNVMRFQFDHEFLTRETEFMDLTQAALDAGAPAEALKFIEAGVKNGAVKVIAKDDRPSRLLAQAKQQTAEDRKLIAQLDKEARNGKNGEADVKVGLAYFGLEDPAKAVEAIERGLTPERVAKVKRVDDAYMTLGMAYLKLGKKEEATKAFTSAKSDPRMAKAAQLWLGAIK